MPDLTRRFTEEEMAVILRRATALQEAREARSMTLEEIQEIGSQVGIDPALVAHVAQSAPLPVPSRRGLLASPPSHAFDERRVPVSVGTAEYGLLLDAIRRTAQGQGSAQQVFDSLEWRTGSDRDPVWYSVTVTGRPEATYLRVDGEIGVAVALAHIVSVGVGAIAMGLAFGSPLPFAGDVGLAAVAAMGIVGGVRAFWRRLLRRTEARVQQLADEVEREVQRIGAADSPERTLPPRT